MICGALQTLNEEACEDVLENGGDTISSHSSQYEESPAVPPVIITGEQEEISLASPRPSEHTVIMMYPDQPNSLNNNEFDGLDGGIQFTASHEQNTKL